MRKGKNQTAATNQNISKKRLYKNKLVVKPILFGLLGSVVLIGFYFIILSSFNSFSHAIQQFIGQWYWISLLVIGFGIQVGLYAYVKEFIKIKQSSGIAGNIVATGGISTASMVACCAHHVSDILPIIGLSAAAIFLTKYLLLFIVVGILSNVIGTAWMLNTIQKHNLYNKDKGFLRNLMKLDMKKSFYFVLGFSIFIFITMLIKNIIGG